MTVFELYAVNVFGIESNIARIAENRGGFAEEALCMLLFVHGELVCLSALAVVYGDIVIVEVGVEKLGSITVPGNYMSKLGLS